VKKAIEVETGVVRAIKACRLDDDGVRIDNADNVSRSVSQNTGLPTIPKHYNCSSEKSPFLNRWIM
jgi:hypothetical protein